MDCEYKEKDKLELVLEPLAQDVRSQIENSHGLELAN